jgi:hypothetical protein
MRLETWTSGHIYSSALMYERHLLRLHLSCKQATSSLSQKLVAFLPRHSINNKQHKTQHAELSNGSKWWSHQQLNTWRAFKRDLIAFTSVAISQVLDMRLLSSLSSLILRSFRSQLFIFSFQSICHPWTLRFTRHRLSQRRLFCMDNLYRYVVE